MAAPFIEFSRVTKRYRKHFWTPQKLAVDGCSFTVEKNAVTGFVGPNGAGKTTSIKMIMGLARTDSGDIRINGVSPSSPASRRGVAFLSERPYFYEHLTVNETLGFSFRLQGKDGRNEKAAVASALEAVELDKVSSVPVKDLSKGMQQRLSMAQALVCDPDFLVLDEPMSGLDPLGRRLFRQLFASLAQQGKTIFFSSHILDDVESLCESVVILSRGKVAWQGAISQLLSQGFMGTSLAVTALPEPARAGLAALGFTVTADKTGAGGAIFVPKGGDLAKCERFLFENSIECTEITRRTASLEDAIYKDVFNL
jgi:ABC-2 type transport system ATP-binding protein